MLNETFSVIFKHHVLIVSGALRLIRLRRKNHPISILSSSRSKSFKLPNWEQDVIDMLSECNIDGKSNPIQAKEVKECLGIWATNGVKVHRSSQFMACVVLFQDFCLLNHRCNPTSMYVPYFDEKSYKVDARAQVDIKAGEEITIR